MHSDDRSQHKLHELNTQGDCKHLLGELSDYLDSKEAAVGADGGGAAGGADTSPEHLAEICAEIEEHMAGCEDCQAVIDTLRKTISLYRTLPQRDMPNDVRERLYTALDLP
jgi:hypothetical protein